MTLPYCCYASHADDCLNLGEGQGCFLTRENMLASTASTCGYERHLMRRAECGAGPDYPDQDSGVDSAYSRLTAHYFCCRNTSRVHPIPIPLTPE